MVNQLPYYAQWQWLPVSVPQWQQFPTQTAHPAVAKLLPTIRGAVLNVGCGIAADVAPFHAAGLHYIGVEVTPKFARYAATQGVPMVVASGCALPFTDHSVDTVYCKDLLVHLPPEQWKILLGEMFRVAARQVITLEGRWHDETRYIQAERYMTERGVLTFYNNAYGESEVLAFVDAFVEDIDLIMGDRWQLTRYLLK